MRSSYRSNEVQWRLLSKKMNMIGQYQRYIYNVSAWGTVYEKRGGWARSWFLWVVVVWRLGILQLSGSVIFDVLLWGTWLFVLVLLFWSWCRTLLGSGTLGFECVCTATYIVFTLSFVSTLLGVSHDDLCWLWLLFMKTRSSSILTLVVPKLGLCRFSESFCHHCHPPL